MYIIQNILKCPLANELLPLLLYRPHYHGKCTNIHTQRKKEAEGAERLYEMRIKWLYGGDGVHTDGKQQFKLIPTSILQRSFQSNSSTQQQQTIQIYCR